MTTKTKTKLAAVLAVLGVLAASGRTALHAENYTPETLESIRTQVQARRAVLLDVRERSEWDQGHLQDAWLLPLSVLQVWERDGIAPAERARIEGLIPRGTVVYCHCVAGGRAAYAAEVLGGLGWTVRPLRQGYAELVGAGFPPAMR